MDIINGSNEWSKGERRIMEADFYLPKIYEKNNRD